MSRTTIRPSGYMPFKSPKLIARHLATSTRKITSPRSGDQQSKQAPSNTIKHRS